MCRQVSSWVGDHQRIPAVDCFCSFFDAVIRSANLNRIAEGNSGDSMGEREKWLLRRLLTNAITRLA
jgi:hypothetical protein